MALRPQVNASHGTVKSVVVLAKKLELGKALSVRAIIDMARLMRVSCLIIAGIQRCKIEIPIVPKNIINGATTTRQSPL